MHQTPQPQAATAPVQAPSPVRSITTVGPDGKPQTLTIPQTSAEMRELLAQRRELTDQLTSVGSRRRTLATEVQTSGEGVNRAGLEERLRVLDQRILQLETDLATTGRLIASAPAELAATEMANRSGGGSDFEEGVMVSAGFMLFGGLIVYFFARRRWKRRAKAIPAQSGAESAQRLERLEQGMDAIALEIERISEGQRFVTKLLSESQSLAPQHRIAQPAAAERPAKP